MKFWFRLNCYGVSCPPQTILKKTTLLSPFLLFFFIQFGSPFFQIRLSPGGIIGSWINCIKSRLPNWKLPFESPLSNFFNFDGNSESSNGKNAYLFPVNLSSNSNGSDNIIVHYSINTKYRLFLLVISLNLKMHQSCWVTFSKKYKFLRIRMLYVCIHGFWSSLLFVN